MPVVEIDLVLGCGLKIDWVLFEQSTWFWDAGCKLIGFNLSIKTILAYVGVCQR